MEHIIEPDYHPKGSEVIARYHIGPSKVGNFHGSLQSILNQYVLGSERSSPTSLPLHAFAIDNDLQQCSIAFSGEIFEAGNIAQHLAILAGELFDDKSLDSINLLSVKWPSHLQASFPGPSLGISELRRLLGVSERPLTSVKLYPKFGIKTKECLEKAYHIWMGGCDIVQENEMMCSTQDSEFEERLQFIKKEKENCSKRTGKVKLYIPNITAATIAIMQHRAKKAEQMGYRIVVVNGLQIGFTSISSIQSTCKDIGLGLFINQSGQKILCGQKNFQLSPDVLAVIYRHLGADGLEIQDPSSVILQHLTESFSDNAQHQKSTFPITTLQHSLEEIENLVKKLGHELIIQAGPSVYRHPDGIKAGSSAFHFAVESAARSMSQEIAVKKNDGLKKALEGEKELVM